MELNDIISENWDISKIPAMGKKLDTIFQYNASSDKTSYLSWRKGYTQKPRKQFVAIGEAFFSTAYNLLQQCLIDNLDKKADSWIFPIMFNIIHGTEVYLKAINSTLSVLLNKNHNVSEGGHDLKALCGTARNLIIEYKKLDKNTTTEQMFEAIKVVEKFIANIYDKTNDMTFARYPLAKNKQGHFYIEMLENEVIDLELLKEQTLYLYNMLNYIYEMPEDIIEMQTRYMEDMMNYY